MSKKLNFDKMLVLIGSLFFVSILLILVEMIIET